MKRELLEQLLRARQDKVPVALVTDIESGAQALCYQQKVASGDLSISAQHSREVREALRKARSGMLAGSTFFIRTYVPDFRLLIVGAVHIAQSLADMATACGYEVTVIDPRRAFATAERFAQVELCTQWPDEALGRLAPDAQTAVVVLSHDPKIDDPALVAALNSEAFYIGALGSRRSHEQRIERLSQQGVGEASARIHAPVGLNLGGRSHTEIALAILAEIVQVRYSG